MSDGSKTDLDWREFFPRGVLDPFGPSDEPVFTPTDRRLLWHIESELAVTGKLGDLHLALYRYLCETCEHHWRGYEVSEWRHPDTGELMDSIPAHRQCLWCSEVEWADGSGGYIPERGRGLTSSITVNGEDSRERYSSRAQDSSRAAPAWFSRHWRPCRSWRPPEGSGCCRSRRFADHRRARLRKKAHRAATACPAAVVRCPVYRAAPGAPPRPERHGIRTGGIW